MKIWAKLQTGEKLQASKIFECNKKLNYNNFVEFMREICYSYDIPTPMILKCQFMHFVNFHNVKFVENDFIESINFDFMQIEQA
ncbi:MAG: hypothetical protein RR454_04365 [Clostridia bacterium]